jgi:hypothetical protein
MFIPEYAGIWTQEDRQQDVDLGRILLTYFDVGIFTK